jgi:fused signal recognition particle receptor
VETSPNEAFSSLIYLLGSFVLLLGVILLVRRRPGRSRLDPAALNPPKESEKLADEITPTLVVEASPKITEDISPKPLAAPKPTWWSALSKTRLKFEWGGAKSEIKEIKAALEEACIVSDLGLKNTEELLSKVSWDLIANEPANLRISKAKDQAAVTLTQWLSAAESAPGWPSLNATDKGPKVIWFVGVNGVGKTTSIAKLASELKSRGHTVLLAAGDTFRAAAGEQLEIWANRLGIECVRGAAGADSSSVLFDAIKSAEAKKIEFVLCDSAGRLHNQSQLMEALGKNKRVMQKALAEAPHETLLVLDAHTGQNMISQARLFHESVQLTGLILTKLDGSARGGAVVAVAKELGLPILRLGLGESPEDFSPFEKGPFVRALVGSSQP